MIPCNDCGSTVIYRKQSFRTPWGLILSEPRCWWCRNRVLTALADMTGDSTTDNLPADIRAAITVRQTENKRG